MRPRVILVLSLLMSSWTFIPNILNWSENNITQILERAEDKEPMVADVEEMMDNTGSSLPAPMMSFPDDEPAPMKSFPDDEPAPMISCPAEYPDEFDRKRASDNTYLDLSHVPELPLDILQGFHEFVTTLPATYSSAELSPKYLMDYLIQELLESLRPWLAITELAPTHLLLALFSLFWHLRRSGGKWMMILNLLSIEMERNLDPDSCLFKVYSVTFLLLQVATFFPGIRNFFWTRTRALCKRGKKQPSSNTEAMPNQGLQPVPPTAPPAPQQRSTMDSVHEENVIISVKPESAIPDEPSSPELPAPEQKSAIDAVRQENSAILSVIPKGGILKLTPPPELTAVPKKSAIDTILQEASAIICATPKDGILNMPSMPPEPTVRSTIGPILQADSSVIAVKPKSRILNVPSNIPSEPRAVPQKGTIHPILWEDSSIISVIVKSDILNESSLLEQPESAITLGIRDTMAALEDRPIILTSPEGGVLNMPSTPFKATAEQLESVIDFGVTDIMAQLEDSSTNVITPEGGILNLPPPPEPTAVKPEFVLDFGVTDIMALLEDSSNILATPERDILNLTPPPELTAVPKKSAIDTILQETICATPKGGILNMPSMPPEPTARSTIGQILKADRSVIAVSPKSGILRASSNIPFIPRAVTLRLLSPDGTLNRPSMPSEPPARFYYRPNS